MRVFICRYSAARISDLRTIGPSDYRALGLSNLRTIEQPPMIMMNRWS